MWKRIVFSGLALILLLAAICARTTDPQADTVLNATSRIASDRNSASEIHHSTEVKTTVPFVAKVDPRIGLNEEIFALLKNGTPESLLKAHRVVWRCKEDEQRRSRSIAADQRPLEDYERRLVACTQLSGEYRRDYLGWLRVALNLRAPGAAEQYLLAGPNGEITDLTLRPDDPLVTEWRKKSFDYLLRDAKQGDVEALETLTSAYVNGVFSTTVDAPMAAGLELALVQLMESKSLNFSARRRKYVADKLDSLSAENRQKAIQIAEEVVVAGKK